MKNEAKKLILERNFTVKYEQNCEKKRMLRKF